MDKKVKEATLILMKSFPKGAIGSLAMCVEDAITYLPVPRLAAWMALEIVSDATIRFGVDKSNDDDMRDTDRKTLDMVREYIRGLSDEEFKDFVSTKSVLEAMEYGKSIGKSLEDPLVGCDYPKSDKDPDDDPGKWSN